MRYKSVYSLSHMGLREQMIFNTERQVRSKPNEHSKRSIAEALSHTELKGSKVVIIY